MKKIFFLLFIFIYVANGYSQENEITTYYFIRHAEKVRSNKKDKNPELKRKGLDRAENWKTVFAKTPFDAIYSTNYNRTIQTATPTAKSKNLEIQFYNPTKLYSEDFQQNTKGKTILIVGHSNTTPQFVNKVLGKEKYQEINDNNNSNLYIITISKENKSDILLVIEN